MRNICKNFLVLIILAFMICITVSDSLAENTPEKVKGLRNIKIGVNTWIGFGPFVLGKEKGIFEKLGLDIELMIIEGTGEFKSAILTKQVMGVGMTIDSLTLSANQGVPGSMVLALDESVGGDGIIAKKEVKNISDLRGKTVAYQTGFPGHFLLLYLLSGAGLTEKDINPQIMETSLAGAAFISKRVDAAVTWEPWLSKASKSEHGHILTSTKKHQGVIVDMLAMHPEFIKNEPDNVQKIIQGWFKSLEYWKDNKKEANAVMAEFYNMPVDEFESVLEGVAFCDLERNSVLFGTKDNPGKIYDVASIAGNIWHKLSIIKKTPIPVTQIMDNEFIIKALKRK